MKPTKFSRYQIFVVAVLAFLQFTIILDFMILSPLGAILMPAMNISPAQFGMVVSAYAFSAGISGLLGAGFADRYDRKRLLLFFYAGFLLGTLFCGLAPRYEFLLAARIVTGIFGGMIGSIVMSIVTDLFPYEMRGRVMGFVQTAFAASQILGIPIGLLFANQWGWHAPFFMIVIVGLVVGIFIVAYLQPITGHLGIQTDKSVLQHFAHTISNPIYLLAFLFMGLLSTGGYMLMPFGSAFTVNNLGIDVAKLPMIYLISGLCTMFAGPLVGRATDSFGKIPVFLFGTIVSTILVYIYTHMGISPLWWVIVVNVVLFVGIFSRIVPAQAFLSSIPDPSNRGAFMAISTSLQQVAGGVAALIAGAIVKTSDSGALLHFDILGYILIGTALVNLGLLMYLHRRVAARH